MITESAYSKKFSRLEPFFEMIFLSIKKEIKREAGVKGSFLQKKFGLFFVKDSQEIAQMFFKNIVSEGDNEVGEWVASMWINRHGDIFQCFHEHLIKISQNYDELKELTFDQEDSLIKDSIDRFGALDVYIFCILNSVVISEGRLKELEVLAKEQLVKKDEAKENSHVSLEDMQKQFDKKLQQVLEKQEKRILGITERHKMEVAGYRKQISQLQKKLESLCAGAR